MTTINPCNGCHALRNNPGVEGLSVETTFEQPSDGACEHVEGVGCVQTRPCRLKGKSKFKRTSPAATFKIVRADGTFILLQTGTDEGEIEFDLGEQPCGSDARTIATIIEIGFDGSHEVGQVLVRCGGC